MVWVKSRCSQSKCTDWSLLTSGIDILDLLFALNICSGPRSQRRGARVQGARRGDNKFRRGRGTADKACSGYSVRVELLLVFLLLLFVSGSVGALCRNISSGHAVNA